MYTTMISLKKSMAKRDLSQELMLIFFIKIIFYTHLSYPGLPQLVQPVYNLILEDYDAKLYNIHKSKRHINCAFCPARDWIHTYYE